MLSLFTHKIRYIILFFAFTLSRNLFLYIFYIKLHSLNSCVKFMKGLHYMIILIENNLVYVIYIPSLLAFYQSCDPYRYRNESERSRYEVHILIVKSIIIFRSSTLSSYRINIFSVLSRRCGQWNGSRKTCAGSEEWTRYRSALVSFTSLKTHNT